MTLSLVRVFFSFVQAIERMVWVRIMDKVLVKRNYHSSIIFVSNSKRMHRSKMHLSCTCFSILKVELYNFCNAFIRRWASKNEKSCEKMRKKKLKLSDNWRMYGWSIKILVKFLSIKFIYWKTCHRANNWKNHIYSVFVHKLYL